MMNFLDLSAASEEERRLIREILSDTSVINIVEPPTNNHLSYQTQHQNHNLQHQEPQHHHQKFVTQHQTTTLPSNAQNGVISSESLCSSSTTTITPPPSQSSTTTANATPANTITASIAPTVPATAAAATQPQQLTNNVTPAANNMINDPSANNNLQNNIYMTSTQPPPPGYAIPPPPHVTTFGPPPHHHHPHHVYSGPPIFHQPYHYLIPYNLPPSCMPYVIPPNPVVPQQTPRHQQQPQQQNSSHQMNATNNRLPNTNANNNLSSSSNMNPRFRSSPHNHNGQPIQQQHQPLRHQRHQQQQHHNNHSQQHQQQTINQQQIQPQLHIQQPQTQANQKSSNQNNNLQLQPQQQRQPLLKEDVKKAEVASLTDKPKQEQPQTEESKSHEQTQQKKFKRQQQLPGSKEQQYSNNFKNEQSNHIGDSQTNQPEVQSPTVSNVNEIAEHTETPSSKSWASLFKRGIDPMADNGDIERNKDSGSENYSDDEKIRLTNSANNKKTISGHVNSVSKEQRSQDAAKRALDKMATRYSRKINDIKLKHSLPFIKPRGFINKGNGCYINATLQALIACPPFYNLMKEIGDLRGFRRDNSCTPILDSFAELFLNFPPLPDAMKKKQTSPQDQKPTHIESLQAEAIEPKCIYNVLGLIKSECLKGAQEDAEEFLSSVLNGLHEEMIGLGEILDSKQDSANQNGNTTNPDDSNDDINNDDNLWREVGSKNRSLPIRTAKVINTPIQEIFGGSLFSIRIAGKDRCGHRSPFFDLQLDISGDNVKSVQDAIKSFTAPEIIHDFYCSKTKQKLDAQRRTSLDQLPPILILHLKQFVYTQDHGLKKLIKKIEYPIDFELPDSCLHEKNSNDKNLWSSRSYKLLAVVYHDGKEAVKGHYLTDVYHIGSSQWIRCDDGNLKVISSPRVDNPDSSRTPYLLFYRRLNTLRVQSGSHDNKKKS